MAITKKLIHFKTKKAFQGQLDTNNILDTSIVFIQDTKEIWTHGEFYPCPYTKEEVDAKINNLELTNEPNADQVKLLLGEITETVLLPATSEQAGLMSADDRHFLNNVEQSLNKLNPLLLEDTTQYEFVDLGLPSGTYWATKNIGASTPEDVGLYFQWGDTQGYTAEQVNNMEKYFNYDFSDYKWSRNSEYGKPNFIKYCSQSQSSQAFEGKADNICSLLLEDDVVYQHYSDGWSIPDQSQLEELFTYTDKELLLSDGTSVNWPYNNYDGSPAIGIRFINRQDPSKFILIPFSGQAAYGVLMEPEYSLTIPSRNLTNSSSSNISTLFFYPNDGSVSNAPRYYGVPYRGVISSPYNYYTKCTIDSKINTIDNQINKLNKLKGIPEGGHERQLLAWKADGEAKWEDFTTVFTGLEELLAYGVEWNVNVADPHLTRIGNMSLHKTLPIQSQLKGCIAQGNKVMYWLDEKDWNYRKNPVYIYPELDSPYSTFNVEDQKVRCFVGQKVRVHGDAGDGDGREWYEGVISGITDNQASIRWDIEPPKFANIELGSDLSGYDGTVRVYCPNFYIKSQIIGDTRRVWLSTVKIDNSWTLQPEILVDAYRSTVLNTVPENMGYLSTLPVNSAISVVNTATYCRGGSNNSASDKYLTGADGAKVDIFRTNLGKPRELQDRSIMRTYARNAGSEMLSYDQYKNIFYWLYVVEYANFNCQEGYKSELTGDGYHQGGMGTGVTTWDLVEWSQYSNISPITPCGYLNEFGNRTEIKNLRISTDGGKTTTFYVPRWRGFDNPFGDVQTNLDGIIIDADAGNHPNNMNYVYTCQDPAKFGDTLTDDWEKIGEEIHQDGYTKLFDLGDAAHIVPKVMGGDTTQYKCDYHLVGVNNTTPRTLIVGGIASDGMKSGLSYFDTRNNAPYSNEVAGFRTVSRFVSFPQNK